jgi:hypothetical protein
MADEKNTGAPDLPDWSQLEERGIAIDAPTPSKINMADPWAPASNGQPAPEASAADSDPASDD